MIVTALRCKNCGDVIYSRTRHDMRYCSCGTIAIDGGRDYTNISFRESQNDFEKFEYELFHVTQRDLAMDWNNGTGNFGRETSKPTND